MNIINNILIIILIVFQLKIISFRYRHLRAEIVIVEQSCKTAAFDKLIKDDLKSNLIVGDHIVIDHIVLENKKGEIVKIDNSADFEVKGSGK